MTQDDKKHDADGTASDVDSADHLESEEALADVVMDPGAPAIGAEPAVEPAAEPGPEPEPAPETAPQPRPARAAGKMFGGMVLGFAALAIVIASGVGIYLAAGGPLPGSGDAESTSAPVDDPPRPTPTETPEETLTPTPTPTPTVSPTPTEDPATPNVPIGVTAVTAEQTHVAITHLEQIVLAPGTADQPAEMAILMSIAFFNGSAAPVDLAGSVAAFTVTPQRVPMKGLDDPTAVHLSQVVQPGQMVEGSYFFAIDPNTLGDTVISFTYGAGTVVTFTGNGAQAIGPPTLAAEPPADDFGGEWVDPDAGYADDTWEGESWE